MASLQCLRTISRTDLDLTGYHRPFSFVYDSTSLEGARELIPGRDGYHNGEYGLFPSMFVSIGMLAV
jgi:hypothetical protein